MKLRKRDAFTLIELVAVLVIMAIIALIVTPLVMNIIRKARIAADKRSVDAYGRSIELAIAGYLMDTGSFPTDINQLTIEYSGDEVVCSTTQLNSDSSVYLAGCTVGGRNVEGYTYGTKEVIPNDFDVGDLVSYNNVQYRVIKDVKPTDANATLLKAEPLSYEDVQLYSAGTGVKVYNENGYGGMLYHSSSNNYATSFVKTTVDAWKTANAPAATEARLLLYDEFDEYTEVQQICTGSCHDAIVPKYDWMYNNDYFYWLGTPYADDSTKVWNVSPWGELNYGWIDALSYDRNGVVRPVIVLPKSAISS